MSESVERDAPVEESETGQGGSEQYGGDQDAEAPATGEDALTEGERDQAEGE